MAGYAEDKYVVSITDLFHDICINDLSFRGRTILVRSYVEIVVRKLLDYPNSKSVELGKKHIQDLLDKHGFTEPFFRDSLDFVRQRSNDTYHTKKPQPVTEADWHAIFDALLNIYSYLFIRFFKCYTFGSNPAIVSKFSLLPPVIRRKVLEQLYEIEPRNTYIVEKLIMSIRKDTGMGDALNWIETNEENLKMLKIEPVILNGILVIPESNWFVKGSLQLQALANWKPLYQTMQEAKSYYEHSGILPETTDENKEFNDLMQFVFLGW